MANACFRCRTAIPSGQTFCGECRSTVSLGDHRGDAKGWWRIVAAGSVVMVGSMLVGALGSLLHLSLVGIGGGLATFLGLAVHMGGLYADVLFLQGRPHLEWTPSDWYLSGLLFASLFVVTAPFVATYYLWRRRRYVGLPR